jgi:hypothetical protein
MDRNGEPATDAKQIFRHCKWVPCVLAPHLEATWRAEPTKRHILITANHDPYRSPCLPSAWGLPHMATGKSPNVRARMADTIGRCLTVGIYVLHLRPDVFSIITTDRNVMFILPLDFSAKTLSHCPHTALVFHPFSSTQI